MVATLIYSTLGLDLTTIKREARAGNLSTEQLLEIIERQQRVIDNQADNLERLVARLERHEPTVRDEFKFNRIQVEASPAKPTTPTPKFGLDAEEKRRGGKKPPKSPGRCPTDEKFQLASDFQDIVPDGLAKENCRLVRERAVWRLIDNKAVLVGYRIYAGPDGDEPRIPGVTPRCEFGIEILVVLSFLIYVIRMSFDKACEVLRFFCELPIHKSQADALLRQLANHWEVEFEKICALIAFAAMVRMDETGWRVGEQKCSLWVFASHLQRLFLFGCHKDDATLDSILPPELFEGIGLSDDAAVYRDRFVMAQKCWAHLLRKAIKLALEHPRCKRYQQFLDQLLALYREAKRVAADQRLGEAGRAKRVAELEEKLAGLLMPHIGRNATTPHEKDFVNLVNELTRLLEAQELFTFVLMPELVEPTNNATEREGRGTTADRDAGRTNKTPNGARRRSIIVSVLESLRASLAEFTFRAVVDEVVRWMSESRTLFDKQMEELDRILDHERIQAKLDGVGAEDSG